MDDEVAWIAWFERLLVNLLSNALKYSTGEVTVRARREGRDVIVSVRDEGRGIPADELSHIFEKYFRATRGVRRCLLTAQCWESNGSLRAGRGLPSAFSNRVATPTILKANGRSSFRRNRP